MSDQSELERRLRAVEDRVELLDLEGRYAYFYDCHLGKEWASLFTEDGVYSGHPHPGIVQTNFVQGRANLEKFCNSDKVSCIHLLTVPYLVIEGDEAKSRVHLQHRGSSTDEWGRPLLTQSVGYYDVSYRRTEEGWRIQRRVTTFYNRTRQITYGYSPEWGDLSVPPLPESGEYPYQTAIM
jgi:hypothetical protein